MRKDIMLCYPFEEQRLAKWKKPYIIQPKLDGDRCRVVIDHNGVVTLLSSEGNAIAGVPHINAALQNLHLHDVELDGELYLHGASHPDIHSVVARHAENIHPAFECLEFHIFDIVCQEPMAVRLDMLHKLANILPTQTPIVHAEMVEDLEEILRFADKMAETGYEGFVIRDAYAPYIRKRSTQMMKFKPRKEDMYEIVGTQQEVSKDGILKPSLGALLCKGDDGTIFGVGSGSLLTRDMRISLWQRRETLPGLYARVRYQHISSKARVPRFPVVVEICDLKKMFATEGAGTQAIYTRY